MNRGHGPIILSLGLLVLVGCQENAQRVRSFGPAGQSYHVSRPSEAPRATLLFDRIPGLPSATAFNTRSDWPSVSAGRRGRDTFYYVTYVNDRQGYGWHDHGYYYRSARYYQVGREER